MKLTRKEKQKAIKEAVEASLFLTIIIFMAMFLVICIVYIITQTLDMQSAIAILVAAPLTLFIAFSIFFTVICDDTIRCEKIEKSIEMERKEKVSSYLISEYTEIVPTEYSDFFENLSQLHYLQWYATMQEEVVSIFIKIDDESYTRFEDVSPTIFLEKYEVK